MKLINLIKKLLLKIKYFFNKLFKTDFLNPESIVHYMFTAESLPEPLPNNETSGLDGFSCLS